jgi:UDP-2-acetamido-3-amino-2,3-dideoxy-glucuronate N-acetyltransferase
MKYTKHETALVDEGAQIADGTRIWHFVHVCAGAKIGKDVSLGQGVFVGNNVTIGDKCKIQNNVTLEDGVFCGPSVVFTNVRNPRSFIERKNEYRDTLIMEGATLGANSTIVCGVTIGRFAFVGAGAVVTKSVKDFALVVGVPAVQIAWISAYGTKLNLPLTGKGKASCEHSGENYELKGEKVTRLVSKT